MKQKTIQWLLCLLLVTLAQADIDQDAAVAKLMANAKAGQPTAVLSARIGNYSEQQAYQIQTALVTKRLAGGEPFGFKAGLTSSASQQKFAVSGPVAGVLLAAPLTKESNKISQAGYHRMMMEMELGFRLKKAVTQPLSLAQLKANIAQVMPVIELPDLGFDQPTQLTAVDIIASNVAAKQLLLGPAIAFSAIDVNALPLSLRLGEQQLLQANSHEVMGDQLAALQWLINRSLANGWVIKPEQLLITGAVGNMLPAKPGDYRADFEALGTINFRITE